MSEKDGTSCVDVSVIVPVYNAQCYLTECLVSIDRQVFSGGIEIIIVDDASDDASGQICSDFSRSSNNNVFFIQHEINRGVSCARNTGLDAAKGEYFCFVDADDILPAAAIQALYSAAYCHDADIVKGNFKVVDDDGVIKTSPVIRKSIVYQGSGIFEIFLKHRLLRGHSWGKLFRKEFKSVRFPLGVAMAEDLLFCASIFTRAKKLVIIPDCIYFYRKHSESTTYKKYDTGTYMDWFDSVDKIDDFILSKSHSYAFKEFKVMTLLQAIREINELDGVTKKIANEVISRKDAWGISFTPLLWTFFRSPRTLFRFIKLELISNKYRNENNAK